MVPLIRTLQGLSLASIYFQIYLHAASAPAFFPRHNLQFLLSAPNMLESGFVRRASVFTLFFFWFILVLFSMQCQVSYLSDLSFESDFTISGSHLFYLHTSSHSTSLAPNSLFSFLLAPPQEPPRKAEKIENRLAPADETEAVLECSLLFSLSLIYISSPDCLSISTRGQ